MPSIGTCPIRGKASKADFDPLATPVDTYERHLRNRLFQPGTIVE